MADTTNINLPKLRDDNPYSIGSVFVFDDGSIALDPGEVNYEKSELDRYYTVIQEEKIGNIAYQAYVNSKLWWIIGRVNNVIFPFDLDSGQTLIIPDLNHIKINNL